MGTTPNDAARSSERFKRLYVACLEAEWSSRLDNPQTVLPLLELSDLSDKGGFASFTAACAIAKTFSPTWRSCRRSRSTSVTRCTSWRRTVRRALSASADLLHCPSCIALISTGECCTWAVAP